MDKKTENLICKMDGGEIKVLNLEFVFDPHNFEMNMTFILDENHYSIKFKHVTVLNMKSVSNDFVIEGFELLDYKKRRWQSDCRYYVHDYETDRLSFYCEDVELVFSEKNEA